MESRESPKFLFSVRAGADLLMKISLVNIAKLKKHENVMRSRALKIKKNIELSGVIHKPIVVDKQTFVILDGHTRVAALEQLGARMIPVYFVDYYSKNVRVYLRKKSVFMKLLKDAVVQMGKSKKVFPARTTMNLISKRPKEISVGLDQLL